MAHEAEEQARESKARRRQEIEREIDAFLSALRKYLLFLADRVGAPPGDQERA
jgi:F0F1-type ATP synthase membrane subunit b/b'